MPGRFKSLNYYNAGALFDALMALVRPTLSKKMKERVRPRLHARYMQNKTVAQILKKYFSRIADRLEIDRGFM